MILKVFANSPLANIKFSKIQLSKIVQLVRFAIRDIPIFGCFLSNAAKDRIDIAKNYASIFICR